MPSGQSLWLNHLYQSPFNLRGLPNPLHRSALLLLFSLLNRLLSLLRLHRHDHLLR
jgi:hypothetical protein